MYARPVQEQTLQTENKIHINSCTKKDPDFLSLFLADTHTHTG